VFSLAAREGAADIGLRAVPGALTGRAPLPMALCGRWGVLLVAPLALHGREELEGLAANSSVLRAEPMALHGRDEVEGGAIKSGSMLPTAIGASQSDTGSLRILGALNGRLEATLKQGLGVDEAENGLGLGVACCQAAPSVPPAGALEAAENGLDLDGVEPAAGSQRASPPVVSLAEDGLAAKWAEAGLDA